MPVQLPNTYIAGQVIFLSDAITDPTTDAPVNDTTRTLTIYKPDGSQVEIGTDQIANPSTGTYTAQITPATGEEGWWEYVWRSTGSGAGASRGRFYVSPVP